MKTKLILMIISLLMPLSAVSANTDNDSEDAPPFPFAKGTLDANGKLTQWSWTRVRLHRNTVIGNLTGLTEIKDKDGAADKDMLGYCSPAKETRIFKTNLDLTNASGLVQLAIQVDDVAVLVVKEILTGNEVEGYKPYEKTFTVNGNALWRQKHSYKEFSNLIPTGRKYELHLTYTNSANLTPNYGGEIDFDGVNIFVVNIPLTVKIKVNNTDIQEDDLVVVSKGEDEELATDFDLLITGMEGLSVTLSLKNADGKIKFKETDLKIEAGKTHTKLWGTNTSSAVDKTIIVVKIKKDEKIIATLEENVTVFKGVFIELKGNYYINVDTREYGKRPWDGRKDPKPNVKGDLTGFSLLEWQINGAVPTVRYKDGDKVLPLNNRQISIPGGATAKEKADYKKAVDQSASFGYQSALSFTKGDNPGIPLYKPWAEASGGKIEVVVDKAFSKSPYFEITADEVIGALVKMKKGHFKGEIDMADEIIDPEIEIDGFFLLSKATATTKIQGISGKEEAFTVGKHLIPQIKAARIAGGYDELLDQMSYQGDLLLNFSQTVFEWSNNTFDITPLLKLKKSAVSKSFASERKNATKINVSWRFSKWNEFQFKGKLKGAFIETQ